MKEAEKVLAYRRFTDHQEMLVLCNFTGDETAVTLPEGWENAEVLVANWENAAVRGSMTLRPYECLALVK